MSAWQGIAACTLSGLLLGGCASTGPGSADVACSAPLAASPPTATTPTGPTVATPGAMNPPPGYPAMMNPTAPMTVSAAPSNIDDSGAKTPSTAANPAGSDCDRIARPARS